MFFLSFNFIHIKINISFEMILQNISKQSCCYLDYFLVIRANSHTHTHTNTHRLLWIQSVYMLSWNSMYHDTGKPAERLLTVEHSPCTTCQPWKSCVPCYRQTCPSKPKWATLTVMLMDKTDQPMTTKPKQHCFFSYFP